MWAEGWGRGLVQTAISRAGISFHLIYMRLSIPTKAWDKDADLGSHGKPSKWDRKLLCCLKPQRHSPIGVSSPGLHLPSNFYKGDFTL